MIILLALSLELSDQLDEGDVLKDLQSLQFSSFVPTSIPEEKTNLDLQEVRFSIARVKQIARAKKISPGRSF